MLWIGMRIWLLLPPSCGCAGWDTFHIFIQLKQECWNDKRTCVTNGWVHKGLRHGVWKGRLGVLELGIGVGVMVIWCFNTLMRKPNIRHRRFSTEDLILNISNIFFWYWYWYSWLQRRGSTHITAKYRLWTKGVGRWVSTGLRVSTCCRSNLQRSRMLQVLFLGLQPLKDCFAHHLIHRTVFYVSLVCAIFEKKKP